MIVKGLSQDDYYDHQSAVHKLVSKAPYITATNCQGERSAVLIPTLFFRETSYTFLHGPAFGNARLKEFGTYFIGYSRSPKTIEAILHNLFVGKPSGRYDWLPDFIKAVIGNLFLVPSATFLENVKSA